MTRAVLLALADRCEREEPSRSLDCDISNAVLGTRVFPHGASASGIADTDGKGSVWKGECAFYTTSLDAAVTLMGERGWGLTWDIESVHAGGLGLPDNIGVCAYVWTGHMTNESSFCRSAPVATFAGAVKWLPRLICAAALRARAAVLPEEAK